MKNIFFSILCICMFFSCSPQKRIARIAKKYNLIQADTVTVRDTTIVPGDTLFFTVPAQKDTVIITEDAKIETVILQDSIYVKVTTKPDTIIKTVKVPYEKIVVQEKQKKSLWWLFLILIVFVFGVALSDNVFKK